MKYTIHSINSTKDKFVNLILKQRNVLEKEELLKDSTDLFKDSPDKETKIILMPINEGFMNTFIPINNLLKDFPVEENIDLYYKVDSTNIINICNSLILSLSNVTELDIKVKNITCGVFDIYFEIIHANGILKYPLTVLESMIISRIYNIDLNFSKSADKILSFWVSNPELDKGVILIPRNRIEDNKNFDYFTKPKSNKESKEQNPNLSNLEIQLKKAVDKEDFKLASSIKKKIEELKKGTK